MSGALTAGRRYMAATAIQAGGSTAWIAEFFERRAHSATLCCQLTISVRKSYPNRSRVNSEQRKKALLHAGTDDKFDFNFEHPKYVYLYIIFSDALK